MLAGPFLPDFLPFPLSVSWSSTHNCSINISNIFYFRELPFSAQIMKVLKQVYCRCWMFHLIFNYNQLCIWYAIQWYMRILQRNFVVPGSFCKMLPECFQLVWKLGSPRSQAELVLCCVPLYSLLWLPYIPLPNVKAKNWNRKLSKNRMNGVI